MGVGEWWSLNASFYFSIVAGAEVCLRLESGRGLQEFVKFCCEGRDWDSGLKPWGPRVWGGAHQAGG